MEQQDQFYGDRFDSSSDAGSDTDPKVRHPGAFSSLNHFPFDMDASPCSSVSLDIDAGDFFNTLNMSVEFFATGGGATEWVFKNSLNVKTANWKGRVSIFVFSFFFWVTTKPAQSSGGNLFSDKKKFKFFLKGCSVRVEQKKNCWLMIGNRLSIYSWRFSVGLNSVFLSSFRSSFSPFVFFFF